MATKWADFCISAVKYNSDGTHIDSVLVHVETDTGIAAGKPMTRPEVVKLLEQKKTFVTIVKTAEGKWRKGAPVGIFPVETRYIKTAADKSERDNLENLPKL